MSVSPSDIETPPGPQWMSPGDRVRITDKSHADHEIVRVRAVR